jgi:hypothetical protein
MKAFCFYLSAQLRQIGRIDGRFCLVLGFAMCAIVAQSIWYGRQSERLVLKQELQELQELKKLKANRQTCQI